jgi:hypothetical protein
MLHRRLLRGTVLILALILASALLAEDPKPRIEVAAPASDATLRGAVPVQAKLLDVADANLATTRVFVGVGGPPWTELQRQGETNAWTVELNSAGYPNGPAKLMFMAWGPKTKRLGMIVPVRLDNGLMCFFADLHGHTSYSDGTLFPATAHQYARETAKLDAFVLTDHSESLDDAEWADIREQAWKANAEGSFVSFPGHEWTKAYGHACIYDPASRKYPADAEGMFKAAAETGAIVKINHPYYPPVTATYTPWNNLAYSAAGDAVVRMIECRNDAEEKGFIRALDLGWHVAPDGSSDTHSPNWGNCGTWTVIQAPSLTRANIWAALQGRHLYSTHDRNCRLHFWVNGAPMGEIVEAPAKEAAIEVDVADPDEADTIARIDVFEDGKIVATDEPKAAARRWKLTRTPAAGKHHFFVKVTQTDGQAMWSAPVWVTIGG